MELFFFSGVSRNDFRGPEIIFRKGRNYVFLLESLEMIFGVQKLFWEEDRVIFFLLEPLKIIFGVQKLFLEKDGIFVSFEASRNNFRNLETIFRKMKL